MANNSFPNQPFGQQGPQGQPRPAAGASATVDMNSPQQAADEAEGILDNQQLFEQLRQQQEADRKFQQNMALAQAQQAANEAAERTAARAAQEAREKEARDAAVSNQIKGTIAEYDSMVGFARGRKINEGLKLLCYGVAAGALVAFVFGWGKE